MGYEHIEVPSAGERITITEDGTLDVPDNPIIPFIEGDGIGIDITPVMLNVVDAAVAKAYGGKREIVWMEIYSGEKSLKVYGKDEWLPAETLTAMREFVVGIKGPMTTPVGGGIRSLNVALRQHLDLYVCQRPVRWMKGVPSPVKAPEKTDMVIFRENTEDIYAGVEWEAGSDDADRVIAFLRNDMGVENIRFPTNCGIGVKPVSLQGTQRLVRRALQYAITEDRDSVTFVHKGNIMKFTEGAFKDWGYELAVDEFGATPLDGGPWHELRNPNTGKQIVIKDMIADAHAAADSDPTGRIRRHRHHESQRRLSVRCARGPGGRHRHRSRREYRRHGGVVRGNSRHCAEVRGSGQGQSGLTDPFRGDDVASYGLARSGGFDRPGHGGRHLRGYGNVRFRTTDDRRNVAQVFRVRRCGGRQDGLGESPVGDSFEADG